MSWWVEFEAGPSGCVEFPNGTEEKDREDFIRSLPNCSDRKVVSIRMLPYPAAPRLNRVDCFTTDGRNCGPCPSFCCRPETCAGKSSCPSNPSCVD